MPVLLSDYDYELPDERIAQTPVEPRDSARLLCVDRATGSLTDRVFRELPTLLSPGDLLVLNETRVSAVRLFGTLPSGGELEALLLRPAIEKGENVYEALVRPGKKVREGVCLHFADAGLEAESIGVTESGGRFLRFFGDDVAASLERTGRVPLPPYITETLTNPERYQTVYAKTPGSAAAPTAGLHFTPALLDQVQSMGVYIARVRLDVGLGTFRPVRVDDVTQHVMHSETFAVSAEAAEAVNACKGRVIAVGTTSLRALESAALQAEPGKRVAVCDGATDIFIYPGHEFKAVDGLITNFHQPHSTLLLLVGALLGRELIKNAYNRALANDYRFLSFGDAMFIF
ncbi:MAG: tRNA preQ1(34) S-adenosylmethionine ribosyltransferase-isomerase QueA [Armatimonas sp.]